MNVRFGILAIIILIAAFSRLIPHIPNVTAIAAMALFGGAYFSNKKMAFIVPIAAMFLSDVALYFIAGYEVFTYMRLVLYGTFILIAMIGLRLRGGVTAPKAVIASLSASILFFVLTNFAVWVMGAGNPYPFSLEGLVGCYTAAIPFFRNTIMGDLIFVTILFGGFELAQAKFPALASLPTGRG
ncbi:MAG: hypothetical protein JKX73_02600 [Flavobacteriales bacterium]|nr:hypothetical protein [Flavobacteriales bacterium]